MGGGSNDPLGVCFGISQHRAHVTWSGAADITLVLVAVTRDLPTKKVAKQRRMIRFPLRCTPVHTLWFGVGVLTWIPIAVSADSLSEYASVPPIGAEEP
jgi:hypothetical protein